MNNPIHGSMDVILRFADSTPVQPKGKLSPSLIQCCTHLLIRHVESSCDVSVHPPTPISLQMHQCLPQAPVDPKVLNHGRWPSSSGHFSPAAGSPCTSSKVICVATAAMYAQAHNSPNTTTSSTMTVNECQQVHTATARTFDTTLPRKATSKPPWRWHRCYAQKTQASSSFIQLETAKLPKRTLAKKKLNFSNSYRCIFFASRTLFALAAASWAKSKKNWVEGISSNTILTPLFFN